MALWIELRCDKELPDKDKNGNPKCLGLNGNQPGETLTVVSDIRDRYKFLKERSLKEGWTYYSGAWVCPSCYRADDNRTYIKDYKEHCK